MKERSTLPTLATALVILAAVAFAYLGSYGSLLYDPPLEVQRRGDGTMQVVRRANYRFGGDAMRTVFAPAHRLDRWLRPEYWELGPAGIDIDIETSR